MVTHLTPLISKTGRTNAPETILQFVNDARREADKHPLRLDPKLCRVAHYRAADMAARDYFSHSGWEKALRKFGFSARGSGENIAYGQDSPAEVMEDWMNSPGHRQNILAGDFRALGVSRVEDIWVQVFTGR